MKKNKPKLRLNRETVRDLEPHTVGKAQGAGHILTTPIYCASFGCSGQCGQPTADQCQPTEGCVVDPPPVP